ncbi:alpha/beta fold hydrolase [Streptomyces sp. NPDC056907]|uniref:alpha/beta fold hydrolase n=1 Tax=unclassified Streptomyces TaxID=2593676 RepID=UPI0036A32E38
MLGASWWQLCLAPLFAVLLGQLALLGHDVAHRAVFTGRRAGDLAGIFLGNLVVGMSYGWWVSDHNRHHAHPNREGAAAVIGHLEQTGHRRVHLVGNSLGGLVALRIAAQRPDLVRTLTLISPVLPALPPAQALRVALLSLPGIPRLHSRLLAAQSTDRQLDDLHRLIYAHPTHVSREHRTIEARERERRAELPYAQEMLSEGVRAVVRAFLSQGEGATWRQARGVTAPTLLVYGREDRLVPFRSAHRAYAAFRDARLLIVPGAGHVAMQEQPGPVAMAIRGLITEADRELATAGDFSIDAVRTSAVKASALHTAQGQT